MRSLQRLLLAVALSAHVRATAPSRPAEGYRAASSDSSEERAGELLYLPDHGPHAWHAGATLLLPSPPSPLRRNLSPARLIPPLGHATLAARPSRPGAVAEGAVTPSAAHHVAVPDMFAPAGHVPASPPSESSPVRASPIRTHSPQPGLNAERRGSPPVGVRGLEEQPVGVRGAVRSPADEAPLLGGWGGQSRRRARAARSQAQPTVSREDGGHPTTEASSVDVWGDRKRRTPVSRRPARGIAVARASASAEELSETASSPATAPRGRGARSSRRGAVSTAPGAPVWRRSRSGRPPKLGATMLPTPEELNLRPQKEHIRADRTESPEDLPMSLRQLGMGESDVRLGTLSQLFKGQVRPDGRASWGAGPLFDRALNHLVATTWPDEGKHSTTAAAARGAPTSSPPRSQSAIGGGGGGGGGGSGGGSGASGAFAKEAPLHITVTQTHRPWVPPKERRLDGAYRSLYSRLRGEWISQYRDHPVVAAHVADVTVKRRLEKEKKEKKAARAAAASRGGEENEGREEEGQGRNGAGQSDGQGGAAAQRGAVGGPRRRRAKRPKLLQGGTTG